MWAAIFEGITALLKAIPYFNRWFTKTPTQKEEEAKQQLREEMDHFRETGRPQ